MGIEISTLEESSSLDDFQFNIIWYGKESTGKTYNVFRTIEEHGWGVIIDTEGKVANQAGKFSGDIPNVPIIEVGNDSDTWMERWNDMLEAVDKGMELLDRRREEKNEIGVFAIDSLSDTWEWATNQHIEQYWPDRDPTEVDRMELSSGMEEDPDWPSIKAEHNAVRDRVIRSPYPACFTCMAQDKYDLVLDFDDFQRPPEDIRGESGNEYKVNTIIHLYEDPITGMKCAESYKCDLVNPNFTGLENPSFTKIRDILMTIRELEEAPEDITFDRAYNEIDYDIELTTGKPHKTRISQDKDD